MIIGVSAKKQHGKDTFARIFQWKRAINFGDDNFPSVEDYALKQLFLDEVAVTISSKKYADKLKDFICMLTGCTREDLENDDFKNSFMPVEFNKIVRGSYASCAGANKQDESLYSRDPKFYRIISDTENRKIAERYQRHKRDYETGYKDYFNPLEYYDRDYVLEYRRTFRDALQEIGTDLMRKQFSGNVWVNATMADYKPIFDDVFPTWIITDVRFPNEVEAIKKRGGIVVRINRPSVPSTDTHESETALDDYQGFDYIITNDKFEDLVVAAEKIMSDHNI